MSAETSTMYCQSCGEELSAEAAFCSSCGAAVGEGSELETDGEVAGEDYDPIMAIEDYFRRTRPLRSLIDIAFLFGSVGLWVGLMAAEFISHYYKLKNEKREPYSDGDKRVWHSF